MSRTLEQVAADEALDAAVNACRDAYVEGTAKGIITEYLVLYASRSWDSDGEPLTAIGRLNSEPGAPLHHQLGMLDYVAAEFRHRITRDDE